MSGKLTGLLSTLNCVPPSSFRLSPVATMIMSASSSLPDASRMPPLVIRSMWSVTTDALPALIASERSPVGIRQTRWSHGL